MKPVVTLLALALAPLAMAGASPWVRASPMGISIDLIHLRSTEAGFQWGAGGGVKIDDLPVMLSIGGEFEHAMNFGGGFTFHRVRLMPIVRMGSEVSETVTVYGMVGIGLTVFVTTGFGARNANPSGLNVSGGGGVEGMVTDNLGVGVEVQMDFETAFLPSWTYLPIQTRAVLTWHFD